MKTEIENRIQQLRGLAVPAACSTVIILAFVGRVSGQIDVGDNQSDDQKSTAAPIDQPTEFMRLTRDSDQLVTMDVAVTRYESLAQDGASVDLIGAVHIGEASYYESLNEVFDQYDVLLYELVAPEGTEIPLGGRKEPSFNPLAMLQSGAKDMLGLESQLEKVDYTKSHFVRADMTPQQISDKMAERGDTVVTLALSAFTDAMRQQNLQSRNPEKSESIEMMEQMSLLDMLGNPLKMKQMMALQFTESGAMDGALGKSLNQLLIVDRNAVAIEELKNQIAAGKKKIGIFYGAAHMPDFEQHLTEDFGLKKTTQRWIPAWDLTSAGEKEQESPANLLLNLLK